jgi:putative membrane protein
MAPFDRRLVILGAVWTIGLTASGWSPYDRATWWMEIAPVLIAFPVLVALRRRFAFTDLALLLIALHGLVLMLGGAYTYARVPIGFVVQDWLHLARNPYDRFGHLMQGFVPAIVLREVLIRTGAIATRRLLTVTVLAYCLSVSALYELIEFGAAVALGQGADAFLGTQGDPWDTQWDMLMCLIGAALALLLLSHTHDRQIARATGRSDLQTL